mgnify:CR=1 FL=1
MKKNNVYSFHTKLNSFHAEMSLAETATDEYFEKVRGNSEIRKVPIGSYDIPFGTCGRPRPIRVGLGIPRWH